MVASLELPYACPKGWTDPLEDIAFTAIPDETFPSDHLAVACILKLVAR